MTRTVAIVTPSHRKDMERCKLLCDSIDRFVTGHEIHYVIVNDDDLPAFQHFNTDRRVVLPCSYFLPRWLKPLPPFFLRKGRLVWWSFRSGPVHGWHIQQLLKIEASLELPQQRFCMIDSDNVFVRQFDIAAYAGSEQIPLHVDPKAISDHAPLHSAWTRSCDRLLGQDITAFPADDYIGNVIVWDKSAVRDMVATIERTTGKDWALALCKTRSFSEYLLYGHFVVGSRHAKTHVATQGGPASAYWDDAPLTLPELKKMVAILPPSKVALCIESFSQTPVSLIRQVAGF